MVYDALNMKCTTCGLENPALCDHPKPGTLPAVTRSKVRYRPLSQTNNRFSWKLIAISAVAAVIGGIGLLVVARKTAEEQMEAQGFFDKTVTLEPGYSQDYHLTSLLGGQYELDVTPHDGPVIMACGMLESGEVREINPAELKAIIEKGVRVEAGKRHRVTGGFSRGKFFWTVGNPSKDKTIEVTIRFSS